MRLQSQVGYTFLVRSTRYKYLVINIKEVIDERDLSRYNQLQVDIPGNEDLSLYYNRYH
jgi:hypothetical protein